MKTYHILLSCLLFLYLSNPSAGNAQCTTPPAGAILITSAFSAVTSIASGQVYYLATGTTINVDHSSQDLTINSGGSILVMPNATLGMNMGGKNFTVNGGTMQVCDSGKLSISPAHDFTMQNSSLITLGIKADLAFCSFGHALTFNGGNIQMNNYSSIEFGDYNNLTSNVSNLVQYTGSGSVGIGTGDPVFHTGGTNFVTYANTNSISQPLTNSTHIDFIDDNQTGTDNPGSANACGPQSSPTYSTCRSKWSGMGVSCGSASTYQAHLIVLPLHAVQVTSKIENGFVQLHWETVGNIDISHFEIERSIKNNQFILIGNILPQPGTAEEYSYTDLQKPFEDTYYRLKAVDKDGNSYYSNELFVPKESGISYPVSCSPNPFNGYIQVRTNFLQPTVVYVELYSALGNLVVKRQFAVCNGYQVTTIDNFTSLPKGLYLMKITTNENRYFEHVIKE